MHSAELIREARLRAGLSQQELAERSGRDRSVIARWEQGAVAPSLESLIDVVRACGFDLPLELVPRNPSLDQSVQQGLGASPEQRLREFLATGASAMDPRPIIAALERERASYVLIGSLARFLRGVDERPTSVEVVPSLRPDNLRRITRALRGLDASSVELERDRLTGESVTAPTSTGTLALTGRPSATRRGYDDLRRNASREHLGTGLRPLVASSADLARLLAVEPARDAATLGSLRRLAEFERGTGRSFEL